MRQTLFYIPETLFAIPLFGWGFGLGLLVAIVIIAHCYQYIRHRNVSGIGGSLAFLGIGGAVLVFVLPNLVEPECGVPIRGYGFCLLLAILAALALLLHLAKRQNIETEKVFSLAVWTVITGIVGARLFYVTQYWRETFLDHTGQVLPLGESIFRFFNFAQGGLVVFGSILGGALGAFIFIHRNKMPVLRTFDIISPAAMLGIAIGRIGCLLNGCCFGGIVSDASWSIVFPTGSPAHVHQVAHGDVFLYGLKFEEVNIGGRTMFAIAEVQTESEADTLGLKPKMVLAWNVQSRRELAAILIDTYETAPNERVRLDFFTNSSHTEAAPFWLAPTASDVLPVHPTQIYSSGLALLLCGILFCLGRLRFYRQRDGLVFASFMILYSVGRFGIEFVRTDEGSFFGTGLTISQNVSIVVCLTGIALLVYKLRHTTRGNRVLSSVPESH